MTYYLRLATFLLASLLVAGCGGGGGSGGNSGGASPSPNTPTNPNTSERTFSAMVTKGPVDNASCELFELTSAGARGSSLGTAVSVNGMVEFSTSHNGEAIIECTGGTYTDEATGETLDSPSLRSAITVENSGENTYTVSPLTELAVQLAETEGDLGSAIDRLNEEVAGLFGLDFDITATTPTDIENADLTDSDEGAYASLLALFSQLDADSSETIGELIASVADDLADGTISASLANRMSTAYGGLLTSDTNISSRLNESLINRLISTAGLPAPNHKPVFSSVTEISIPENSSELEYNASATDSDGDTLSYSISGDDSGLFSIDSSTGALNIVSAPDYESPEDLDANNQYNITLVADDNKGGIAQMGLSVLVTDQTQLAVHVTYPTPDANLGGEATQTTVTGRVIDEEDGELTDITFESLTVNDVYATFDIEDPYKWRAQIPVSSLESTEVNVELLGDDSGTVRSNFNVQNRPVNSYFRSTVVDSANNRLLVADQLYDTLVAIDLSSGSRTVISSYNNDTGDIDDTSFILSSGIALDTVNNRVLISSVRNRAIVAVDLSSGIRSVLSDENNGTGTNLGYPYSIAIDSSGNRALIVDTQWKAIFSVDLNTGNRTILSDYATGSGILFNSPQYMALDIPNNRALLTDPGKIISVNLSSGDRTILSDSSTGVGPDFAIFKGITVDSSNNRAVVLNLGPENDPSPDELTVFLVDLTTGNRTILSVAPEDTHIYTDQAEFIALDSNNNRVFLVDNNSDIVSSVDLSTGSFSIFSQSFVGTGSQFSLPEGVALDLDNNLALVIDAKDGLFSVDLNTGDRSIISDDSAGTGINFSSGSDVVLDKENNRAIVSHWHGLVGVDFSSGNRTSLSDGSGPDFGFAAGVVLDSEQNRALVMDTQQRGIFSVDLSSGNRSIVSDGTGPTFIPSGLIHDNESNRVLVTDSVADLIFIVDLVTGNRSVLPANISGPTFTNPQGISLDEHTRIAYVVDMDSLISVDINIGTRTAISSNLIGTGSRLMLPVGLEVDGANERAFVIDKDLKALFIIDLGSGERAIISK